MINDIKTWTDWNLQGFLPGPEETEKEFLDRITFCQNLQHHLTQTSDNEFPFIFENDYSENVLDEPLTLTKDLFGIAPTWVPLFFSNYQLSPWHGGCAWIFQLTEQTPTAAFLQLRRRFLQDSTYLGLYKRSELISHEMAHVGRMLYNEPQYEEILAYQTSSSKWRRWLGPIVQSSKESLFFILLIGFLLLVNTALLSLHRIDFFFFWCLQFIPVLVIFFALARLMYRHYLFNKCMQNLTKLFESKTAMHFIYRLRDNEIKKFAFSSPFEIMNFMSKESQLSFRWKFLNTLYPPEKTTNE